MDFTIHAIQHTGVPDPATTTMLRTALISVTCLSIIISAMIFIIGFVCGHYLSQRRRKSAASDLSKERMSNTTNERREDLELKENIAYITLCSN